MYTGSNPVSTSGPPPRWVAPVARPERAIGAAVARFPDTEEVTGSIPVSPTRVLTSQTPTAMIYRGGRYVVVLGANGAHGCTPQGDHSEDAFVRSPPERHYAAKVVTGRLVGARSRATVLQAGDEALLDDGVTWL